MTEFDLIRSMIGARFHEQPDGDGTFMLVETKHASGRTDHIIKSKPRPSTGGIALFRFSLDDFDFLPFFNNPPKKGGTGPRHLKKFCDYIMLVQNGQRLHVILVEMKRSKQDPEMGVQLRASEQFMRYVIESGERIKHINALDDFDPKQIVMHKICLKQFPGMKITRCPDKVICQTPVDEIVTLHNLPVFNPCWVFKHL